MLQGARPVIVSPPVFRCDYNVYSTFQSHEPEFDYLKSLEIEEKINQICWVKQSGSSLFLLTTNGEAHTYSHSLTHTHACMHTHTHTYTHTHTHTHWIPNTDAHTLNSLTYPHTHSLIHSYTHVQTRTHTHLPCHASLLQCWLVDWETSCVVTVWAILRLSLPTPALSFD